MSCISASHSMNSILSQVEPQMEESPGQRRGSRAYQIFPETNMNKESDSCSYPEDFLYRRERLPSIVVEPTEPTEHSELESGQLCWPPQCQVSNSMEEEEDSNVDNTEASVGREQHDDFGTEGGVAERKCSIGPSQSQLSICRLTPPSSPTPVEAVPPCLKS